jgi:hypothetical protein
VSLPVVCAACVKRWHRSCPGLRVIEGRIVGPCECGCQQMSSMPTPARVVPEEPPKPSKLEWAIEIAAKAVFVAFVLAVVLVVLGLLLSSVGDGPSCAGIDDLATSGRCGDP